MQCRGGIERTVPRLTFLIWNFTFNDIHNFPNKMWKKSTCFLVCLQLPIHNCISLRGVIFSNKAYGCQIWSIKRGCSVFVIVCFDNSCVLLTLIFSEAVMWETWIAISHTILNGLKNVNNIFFFCKFCCYVTQTKNMQKINNNSINSNNWLTKKGTLQNH